MLFYNTNPAIFVDRDGTINLDHGYVFQIDHFQFIDGIINAMQELILMGFSLVIVTNQSGIARGVFTITQFIILTTWMKKSLLEHDVHIDGVYFCPHHPMAAIKEWRQLCSCRKPKPGMLLTAKKELHIDMSASYMIGDKIEDMQAAQAAGVGKNILVRSGKVIPEEHIHSADYILNSFKDLPQYIKESAGSIR
ncbi:D-glycero-beta-D-manno-heptose-1,7-bisphosphate 7-phosphatase [Candidatus Erwinia haradaeae]|uniref:D,D-heptose 1,7-bisphosphate phosphatase n=1 Tax=Candidatus Erwinia haradaeae TaxID=1922217 RepID=A0A451DCD6_9GAMM|nr:D-glycero-beta-D-manno-heptose 1,7-bisphosphate 7-phosphatase [Candidatus Erwinia haradaeae]VFP84090.1 D-glycero-beta-D-manno-heptose-1,7-bisphosphate 7-phosphatase [Candidatus Erwinia haradaeae]